MPINDVYQVVDTMEFAEQKCINVYFYKMTSATIDGDNAEEVVEGFVAGMIPLITACQTSDINHTSVKATNLFDPTDQFEALISEPGLDSAGFNSTFDAFGFRLVGDNAAVRSGAKRVPGVQDDAAVDGVIVGAGVLGALNDLADAFASNVLFGLLDAGTLVPVIVKRLLVGGDYVLPTSIEDAVLSVVTDALLNALVTSQTSRKVGRGD